MKLLRETFKLSLWTHSKMIHWRQNFQEATQVFELIWIRDFQENTLKTRFCRFQRTDHPSTLQLGSSVTVVYQQDCNLNGSARNVLVHNTIHRNYSHQNIHQTSTNNTNHNITNMHTKKKKPNGNEMQMQQRLVQEPRHRKTEAEKWSNAV